MIIVIVSAIVGLIMFMLGCCINTGTKSPVLNTVENTTDFDLVWEHAPERSTECYIDFYDRSCNNIGSVYLYRSGENKSKAFFMS